MAAADVRYHVHRLALGLLLLTATPAAADDRPVRTADAWCEAHPGEVLVRDADGVWHRVTDDLPRQDDEGSLLQEWSGSLDGDRRDDLVLSNVGGCGTRECPFEAFVSCADGTYSRVLAPEYADKVKVKRRKHGWATIALRTVGERNDASRYLWTRYRLGASGYD